MAIFSKKGTPAASSGEQKGRNIEPEQALRRALQAARKDNPHKAMAKDLKGTLFQMTKDNRSIHAETAIAILAPGVAK